MILFIIAYLLIAIAVYQFKIKDWPGHSTAAKMWYSFCWILLIPLYGIHWLHNR